MGFTRVKFPDRIGPKLKGAPGSCSVIVERFSAAAFSIPNPAHRVFYHRTLGYGALKLPTTASKRLNADGAAELVRVVGRSN